MDNNFNLTLAKDKQRLCAKIALRRAKRVFALIKAGRMVKKRDLEEVLIRFDIYCDIFEDAVKQETEIRETEARRLQELRDRQVFKEFLNG